MPVHRTIVLVDVEGFGDRRRTNAHQVVVRAGMYQALEKAFGAAGIAWDGCRHEDRGDGVFLLAPAELPKGPFVELLPAALVAALGEHNRTHGAEERIRLRLAVHAGEVNYDRHGVTGAAINHAFRLLDAHALKAALAASPGVLALITSSWFFDEVVRHSRACDPATYRPIPMVLKETRTVGWIHLPDHPTLIRELQLSSADPGTPTPRQLPGATSHFVGRVAELAALTRLMGSPDAAGTVVITAINGTAGIGKTTLALRWAHRVKDRFSDGQLYVNLRGFDPTSLPMTPGDALRGFLIALGVSAERVPVNLDEQAALYRSLLADRKVLVLLDNAHDAEQVRPLLPGSARCLTLVTSRSRLAGLVSVEGAWPVTLELLTAREAWELLVRRLGEPRVRAEPEAMHQIIDFCARLPLALSIVAARATAHPTFPLTELAGELRDARGGLDAFHGGDASSDVRAVFSWSYRQLGVEASRMFRLLGLHPGPDISLLAATSLAGIPSARARPILAELAEWHLIDERAVGRFTFHDLLRAYATELAMTSTPNLRDWPQCAGSACVTSTPWPGPTGSCRRRAADSRLPSRRTYCM